MSPFSGLNTTIANQNYFLYTNFNKDPSLVVDMQFNRNPNHAIILTDDLMIAQRRVAATLVLGVQGNRIVTVAKSKFCVVRFFQAIANFFRKIDTSDAKVKALSDESWNVLNPLKSKVLNSLQKGKNAFESMTEYLLPHSF